MSLAGKSTRGQRTFQCDNSTHLKSHLKWYYRKISNTRRTKSQNLKWFSSRLAFVLAQSIETRCEVESYIRGLTVLEIGGGKILSKSVISDYCFTYWCTNKLNDAYIKMSAIFYKRHILLFKYIPKCFIVNDSTRNDPRNDLVSSCNISLSSVDKHIA